MDRVLELEKKRNRSKRTCGNSPCGKSRSCTIAVVITAIILILAGAAIAYIFLFIGKGEFLDFLLWLIFAILSNNNKHLRY